MGGRPSTQTEDRSTADGDEETIVAFESVSKRFGRVTAVEDVSLRVFENEILGVVGDNGAGKSSLMKILAGVHGPTGGTLRFGGRPVEFADPSEARELGIETVYQDLALMDDLDVATNVFMGRFPTRFSFGPIDVIDWQRTYEEAGDILSSLGQELDLHAEVEFLSGGQRQLVAVARSLLFEPEVIVFDEPTSALSLAGTELVHDTMRRLRDEGHTQIVISHNVEDIIELADRIAVMYQGRLVDVIDPDDADRELLATMMRTGRR